MAQTVLSMATGRPLPDQGRGLRLLYIIFDAVIFVLTIVLIISLLRLRKRFRELRRRGIPNRAALVVRIVLLHFVWPLVLLYLIVTVIDWRVVLFLYQPDLGYWLSAVAIVVVLKGLLELVLLWRVPGQTSGSVSVS
jgi:hypothetical protein